MSQSWCHLTFWQLLIISRVMWHKRCFGASGVSVNQSEGRINRNWPITNLQHGNSHVSRASDTGNNYSRKQAPLADFDTRLNHFCLRLVLVGANKTVLRGLISSDIISAAKNRVTEINLHRWPLPARCSLL